MEAIMVSLESTPGRPRSCVRGDIGSNIAVLAAALPPGTRAERQVQFGRKIVEYSSSIRRKQAAQAKYLVGSINITGHACCGWLPLQWLKLSFPTSPSIRFANESSQYSVFHLLRYTMKALEEIQESL